MTKYHQLKSLDDAAAAAVSETPLISKDISADVLSIVQTMFNNFRYGSVIPPSLNTKDSYSHFIRNFIQVRSIQRGKISCILHTKPSILNLYGGMHGGAVTAVAELVANACARTVVGEDKELFLGELSISYLSAAPENAKVLVDGSVVKSGRNVTAIAIEFKLEESGRLVYSTRITFYNMPASSL